MSATPRHFKRSAQPPCVRDVAACLGRNLWQVLGYEIVFKLVLAFLIQALKQLSGTLLWHIGRPAFTSGDLPYLLRTWEGWGLALIGLLVLILYTVFEISTLVVLCAATLHGERPSVGEIMRRALGTLRQLLTPTGILVALYVALAGPLAGASIGISLTQSFYIPDFILSVITGNTVLRVLYTLALVALGALGFIYLFAFHGIALDGRSMPESLARSHQIVRVSWRALLWNLVKLTLASILAFVLLFLVTAVAPALALDQLQLGTNVARFWTVFLILVTVVALGALYVLLTPLTIMLITASYEQACGRPCASARASKLQARRQRAASALACVCLLALCAGISLLASSHFDEFFPATSTTRVIAHRGAGVSSSENTADGIRTAGQIGAYGSEIDIQRTADGAYVLNHDADFSRLYGDSRKPSEMTLAEVKQLQVHNETNPLAPTTTVPTLEEALDAARDNVHLFIELKGETADQQMAEDAYRAVADRGMLDQCAFISLDYGLIDYLETAHPEAETGYLLYLGFGELGQMNCDLLLVEEETATPQNIERIHSAGKQVGVWTVNDMTDVLTCATRGADYVITDEAQAAVNLLAMLHQRDDALRVADTLTAWL